MQDHARTNKCSNVNQTAPANVKRLVVKKRFVLLCLCTAAHYVLAARDATGSMLFVDHLPCKEGQSLQLVLGDRGRRHFQLQAGHNEAAVARPHVRILPEARARRGLEAKQGGCKHVTSAPSAAPRCQGVKQIPSASRKSGYDMMDAGLQLQVTNKSSNDKEGCPRH
jgi:hypothetical protein